MLQGLALRLMWLALALLEDGRSMRYQIIPLSVCAAGASSNSIRQDIRTSEHLLNALRRPCKVTAA